MKPSVNRNKNQGSGFFSNGRFTGILTQSGNEFPIAGTWLVRNLILTTAFDFNGFLQRHITAIQGERFDDDDGDSGGSPRQWAGKQ